jgi:hypothetical protein
LKNFTELYVNDFDEKEKSLSEYFRKFHQIFTDLNFFILIKTEKKFEKKSVKITIHIHNSILMFRIKYILLTPPLLSFILPIKKNNSTNKTQNIK